MNYYIVEDHPDMRLVLKLILQRSFPDLSLAGESETGEQAIEEIPAKMPELLLVDISLPGIDGIEVIRRLRPICKDARFILITAHEIEHYEQAAREAGADDIVSKSHTEVLIGKIDSLIHLSAHT